MSDDQKQGGSARPVDRVTRAFLILDSDQIIQPLKRHAGDDSCFAPIVLDAIEGLTSVVAAASIPFALTYERVHQARFQGLHAAERIRALKHTMGDDLTPELQDQAFDKATAAMRSFLTSPQGNDLIRDAVIDELDRATRQPETSMAAHQLLSQALVATWSVMEVFCSALTIASVNRDPTLARRLLESPDLKKHFGKPTLDLDALDAIGYDLTASMGHLLFAGRRMDSLPVIRALMEVIAPSEAVRLSLHHEQIWILNQRRHLIVHRRGRVDREYLGRTADNAAIGSRLVVCAGDIERYLEGVRDALVTILDATAP